MEKNKEESVRTITPISWYPGHMHKTKKELKSYLKYVDVVIELIDARVPYSSKIKELSNLYKNKEHILIMTKKDLCDISVTNKWMDYYIKEGIKTLLVDLKNNIDFKKIISLLRYDKKVLIIGLPNVGKSTLINLICNKKVTKVGNEPGVTKNLNWLKGVNGIQLLDTPGILSPKFESDEVAHNLASTKGIKTSILNLEEISYYILDFLNNYYPHILKERYNIENETDIILMFSIIAKNIGAIKNDEIDYTKVSEKIYNDLNNGLIKGITLDRWK